jgi:hypothetical protein
LLIPEILQTNGSIAFALQTMITLLNSMAYYDQMGQFDKWTRAEMTSFKIVQVPTGYVGFSVVVITVTAHCVLMAYCVWLFIQNTAFSRLGASWSAVAQVATGDVWGLLDQSKAAVQLPRWQVVATGILAVLIVWRGSGMRPIVFEVGGIGTCAGVLLGPIADRWQQTAVSDARSQLEEFLQGPEA